MSLDRLGIDNNIIDALYKKYGFLDEEGFLIGTNHQNFLTMQKRVDELGMKTNLTPKEEKEGAELVIVHKAYMKELENYVLNDGEVLDDDDEDFDFEPGQDDNHSDNLSYDSYDSYESSDNDSEEK